MAKFKVIFHKFQITNDKEDTWKLKKIVIGKIPSRLIFESLKHNIPIFKDSFIALVEQLDYHENHSINGKELTKILKKEFGSLHSKN